METKKKNLRCDAVRVTGTVSTCPNRTVANIATIKDATFCLGTTAIYIMWKDRAVSNLPNEDGSPRPRCAHIDTKDAITHRVGHVRR